MANVSRGHGFVPVKHLSGAPYNGQANIYEIAVGDGTATMVGDLVKLSSQAATSIYATVERNGTTGSVASGLVVGVIVGFIVDPTVLNTPQYRAASTKRFALVADDPFLIFECQEDSVGGSLALDQVGLNIAFMATAGSTSTGLSGMLVDSSTAANTSTLPLRFVGYRNSPDNVAGISDTVSKVLVMIQNHQFVGAQTSV